MNKKYRGGRYHKNRLTGNDGKKQAAEGHNARYEADKIKAKEDAKKPVDRSRPQLRKAALMVAAFGAMTVPHNF